MILNSGKTIYALLLFILSGTGQFRGASGLSLRWEQRHREQQHAAAITRNIRDGLKPGLYPPDVVTEDDRRMYNEMQEVLHGRKPTLPSLIGDDNPEVVGASGGSEPKERSPELVDAELRALKEAKSLGINPSTYVQLMRPGLVGNDEVEELKNLTEVLAANAHFVQEARASDLPLLNLIRNNKMRAFSSHFRKGKYDVNARDETGRGVIHYAALLGASQELDKECPTLRLVLAGKDDRVLNLNLQTRAEGFTALHLVAQNEKDAALPAQLLLEAGADVNVRDNVNHQTALAVAIASNTVRVFDLLIDAAGIDLNSRDRFGETPLHMAVTLARVAMIEPLLARGADVLASNDRGLTPLGVAVRLGDKDTLGQLVGAFAKMKSGNSDTLQLYATRQLTTTATATANVTGGGQKGARKAALIATATQALNHVDADGCTALHVAARALKSGSIRMLRNAGCDLNIRDANGRLPIDVAIEAKRPPQVLALLAEEES